MFLLGPRYSGGPINKIVYGKYHTYAENYVKCFEQLREIYWESIRAPDRWAVTMRNPYRREQLRKKFFGRTKEERQAFKKSHEEDIQRRKEEADKREMEEMQNA